jgi:hypothetical protein
MVFCAPHPAHQNAADAFVAPVFLDAERGLRLARIG